MVYVWSAAVYVWLLAVLLGQCWRVFCAVEPPQWLVQAACSFLQPQAHSLAVSCPNND
jgi:hypothetical protein